MKKIRSGVKRVLKQLSRCDDARDLAEFLHNVDAAILAFIRMIAFIVGLCFGKKCDDENDGEKKRRPVFSRDFSLNNVFSGDCEVAFTRFTPLYYGLK